IMKFAQQHQGVGNKIDDLKKEFKSDEIQSIKLFSAKFQENMQSYQIFTGNQNAKKLVGARLHRLATDDNINLFFRNNSICQLSSPPQPEPRGASGAGLGARARAGAGAGLAT
ncbi:MAG: hypothetical protein ACKO47_03910, partial [Alphaproteobacteria bacterium]